MRETEEIPIGFDSALLPKFYNCEWDIITLVGKSPLVQIGCRIMQSPHYVML
jgi:hypothetical protein